MADPKAHVVYDILRILAESNAAIAASNQAIATTLVQVSSEDVEDVETGADRMADFYPDMTPAEIARYEATRDLRLMRNTPMLAPYTATLEAIVAHLAEETT